jgi:hypothetical protein
MNPQLDGIERIPGTYVFDLAASVRTLRLNRFFWRMTEPAHRARFHADEEALYESEGLTADERDLVRRRDWLGLVRYGVNFFVLEKFARVVRLSNPEVYASMRGETLEAFLATRNVPGAR